MKTILLILTFAGVAILLWIGSIYLQSQEALRWPQTKGHIDSSTLQVYHWPKINFINSDYTRWFTANIEYEYSVGEYRYTSSQISFRKVYSRSSKEALKLMNAYRQDQDALVYYNPNDPMQSVLDPSYTGDMQIPLMVGVILVIIGLFTINSQFLESYWGQDDYLHRGLIYQNQGRAQDALVQYNQFIKRNPYNAGGYRSRGYLFFQQGHFGEAIKDLRRAISIDPNDALAYYTLANAYSGNNEYKKAWENIQKAVKKGFEVKPEILENFRSHLGLSNLDNA